MWAPEPPGVLTDRWNLASWFAFTALGGFWNCDFPVATFAPDAGRPCVQPIYCGISVWTAGRAQQLCPVLDRAVAAIVTTSIATECVGAVPTIA